MKKINKTIKILKEIDLCNKEQRVIETIDDTNVMLDVVIEE